jgi:hypothetical protein
MKFTDDSTSYVQFLNSFTQVAIKDDTVFAVWYEDRMGQGGIPGFPLLSVTISLIIAGLLIKLREK